MVNIKTLIHRINQGKVFFFAGSGISLLSSLPSAGKVLSETAKLFLPPCNYYKSLNNKIIIDENNYYIQPEVLYETLLYLTKSIDSLILWKCLSPIFLKKNNCSLLPNINHFFIVDYSVKNKTPIFTTNFDCLFEEAAEKLNYGCEVVLPHTEKEINIINSFKIGKSKDNTVYIFKLHGSISIENTDSLNSLCTTMTSISRVNYPVIEFIEELCRKKHLVFLGYSGRDIDFFPEIKRKILKLYPFWIDEFIDSATKDNCEYINAIPVYCYPDVVFREIRPELDYKQPFKSGSINSIFILLKNSLKGKVAISVEDKILFLGLLLKEVGEYKAAYSLMLSLYRNNAFNNEKQIILLLGLSRLAHENSRYQSCWIFAEEARKISNKYHKFISYFISSICQISESKRMLIAYDTSLFFNINYIDYICALASFIKNGIIIYGKLKKIKRHTAEEISDIIAIHDSLEHQIRFVSLLQILINPIYKISAILSEIFRKNLLNKWVAIRYNSYKEGYSHGIANCIKYETRIVQNDKYLKEGQHIYALTTYETGKGLSLRNIADDLYALGEYEAAIKYYLESVDISIKCGNQLNAIKGLLRVAKCNNAIDHYPILEDDKLVILKKLMENVEGENWKEYFNNVLYEIRKI